MSSISKPRLWICAAATAAAFWITFRVLDADAAAETRSTAAEELRVSAGLPDPALDALIQRFADRASGARE